MNSYPQVSNYESWLYAKEFKLFHMRVRTIRDEETKYSQSFPQQHREVGWLILNAMS